MGDNGKINSEENKQPEKTEEQLMAERLERYQKDPKSFIEISEIILCCIRNPKSQLGVSVFVGRCKRSELDIANVELNHITNKQRMQMDIAGEMKQQIANGLIKTPRQHGMMNFARKIAGRK